MAEGKRKLVWFGLLEKALLEYAEARGNFSEYIKSLIRRDMSLEEKGVDPKVIEYLEGLVETKLAGKVLLEQETGIDISENVMNLF